MEMLRAWLEQVSQWIWGPVLLTLLLGTGLYLTILLRGIQFRYLWHSLCLVLKSTKKEGEGDISPFEALATSLASAIGTGNIAGVAIAVTIGGLGAIFWMWISGLLGMAIQYSEAALGVRFRTVNRKGEMSGGPMYYIRDGLGWKWLATLYAIFGILASFGIGNLVQAHSISEVLQTRLHLPAWASGLILAIVVALIIVRGIRSIGKVAEFVVPIMASIYVLGGLVILVINYAYLPEAIGLIFKNAFTGQAAFGGFMGASATLALRMGLARGLFSNEAGLGSGAIAASAAATSQPARQAMINMAGTFIDTLIVCTITGLTLAVTGVLGTTDAAGNLMTGGSLTSHAFASSFTGGGVLVSVALVLFALTTIIAWAYYGEKCLEYLAGVKIILPYRVFFVVVVFVASIVSMEIAWSLADIFNGLMVLPNLIALLALSGVVAQETRLYRARLKGAKT